MQVLVIFYVFLGIFAGFSYLKKNDAYLVSPLQRSFLSFFYFLFFIIFVSTRSSDHPGDTEVYLRLFRSLADLNLLEIPDKYRIEKGFILLTHIIGKISSNESFFMATIAAIQVSLWYVCFKVWINKNYILISVVVFCSLFTSYNLGANVLRQGIALPIAFIALKLLFDRKLITGILLILLASLFHKTVFLVLACWALSFEKVHIKYYFTVWGCISFLSLVGFFEQIISFTSVELSSYSHLVRDGAVERYKTGFRLDFWCLSALPLGLYCLLEEEKKKFFSYLLKTYLAIFSVFIILFEIPYSDRVGLYSWSMLPIMIALFIGSYRLQALNSGILTTFIMVLLGVIFFQFYSVMDVSFYFKDVL